MNRRTFIQLISQGLLGAALSPNLAFANHPTDKRVVQFVFAQINYRGGDWNPHPLSVTPLMEELMVRTSVEAATVRHEVALTDRDLFNYPFLYFAGKYEFEPFSPEEIDNLRRFLSYGGFLLIDDALGQQGYGFDKAVRREMQKVFPGNEFKRRAERPRRAAQLLFAAPYRRRAHRQSHPRRDYPRQLDAGDLLPERSRRRLGARSARQMDQRLHARRRSPAQRRLSSGHQFDSLRHDREL